MLNACHTKPKSAFDDVRLYQCMNVDYNEDHTLEYQSLLDYYNEQFGYSSTPTSPFYARQSSDLEFNIIKKWQVYLLSLGTISIQSSKIKAPRIGVCGNDIFVKDSKIDATERGCGPDSYPYLGENSDYTLVEREPRCSGAGGAHGGAGGHGAAENTDEAIVKLC